MFLQGLGGRANLTLRSAFGMFGMPVNDPFAVESMVAALENLGLELYLDSIWQQREIEQEADNWRRIDAYRVWRNSTGRVWERLFGRTSVVKRTVEAQIIELKRRG